MQVGFEVKKGTFGKTGAEGFGLTGGAQEGYLTKVKSPVTRGQELEDGCLFSDTPLARGPANC